VVTWYHGKQALFHAVKPSMRVVTAWLEDAVGGPPLQSGTLRCEIRAATRLAKSITFNVAS
jgi:hypothetical protein